MQQNLNYTPQIFWMDQHMAPPVPNRPNMFPQPPFPDFRNKRHKDGTCTYLLIIFLLVLLALAGVGLGTYKIIELQKELDQFKEISSESSSPSYMEKLIGLNTQSAEKKEGRLAAHVTGKPDTMLPLAWEDKYGRAFTSGIQYKDKGLVVNQTGLHFLYSSVYFRGTACQKTQLYHVVYKKPMRYPKELKLMETTDYHYCTGSGMWGRHSYLGAVFNLSSSDTLYVNVSDINLVSFEESKTFFGLYKL
ncbi:tumor necrosis factor ligand superfamily member 6 [Bombina bombina]|uniref:tumor necrosis factor ligand superfamily member 6 n=1 Tax=Bombina bombina TaxID=8345 RepID=UPI00235AA9F4|nr:tumor necrosis factor ligand superfamily member 6 [Bombina bombina]